MLAKILPIFIVALQYKMVFKTNKTQILGGIMKKLIFLFTLSLLLVGMAWGQTYLIQEGFETTSLPTGWSGDVYFNTSANIGNLTGANGAGFNANNKYLQLPALDNVGILTFWMKGSAATSRISMKVQKKVGTGDFVDIALFPKNHDTTATQYTINVNDSSSDIVLQFLAYDRAGNSLYIDDIEVTQDSASPIITVSPSALTDFGYVYGSTTSTSQSYTLSGANLTGFPADITVTGSTNYEVSTDDENFATSKTVAYSSATLSDTPIYVRLKTGLAIGAYDSETISNAGGGATTVNITCSGEVTAPPPPEAPVATAATDIDDVSFIANWEAVNDVTGYYLDVYTKTAGTNATDLFISEYIEGASFNKAIEIYNGTGIAVDLSTYSLKKQTNGAGDFKNELVLSGILEPSDVYITAHSRANATILALANDDNEGLTNFNGNDAVALYKDGVMIDVVGFAGQVAMWGENITLVRKNTITSPTIAYNIDDWDQYPEDTMEYLGSHTMAGASSNAFVTGYNNFDVGNLLSYPVTGLNPETTYYYVVRAYHDYQTHMLASVNSNEISVTTEATEDSQVVVNGEGDDTVTGATLIVGGAIPDDLLGPDTGIPAVIYTITSSGIKDVLVNRHSSFGNVDWYCWLITPSGQMYGADSIDAGNNSQLFRGIDFGDNGDVIVIMNDNPTLPVELSSFTVAMNAYNNAVLTWVTQTETSVNGFHIYRNMEDDLENAELISNLIPATNTSQQQVYVYSDKELNSTGTYYYWLQVSDLNGSDSFHGPITLVYEEGNDQQIPVIPEITELKKVFPNPFNPSATISYGLVDAAPVSIRIYNSRGQMVRSFEEGMKNAGSYNLTWNGDDDRGRSLSTGVYYIRMQAGNQTFNKKVVLMK